MLTHHTILTLLWIIYGILHSVLASVSVKDWFENKWPAAFRYYRLSYTIFSFLGFVAILYYQITIPTIVLFDQGIFITVTGLVFASIGLGLLILMIYKYFMQLSGVRWLTQEKASPTLETKGMHKVVRHPLYLATFSFIWGLFLLYPYLSLLLANIVITVYTIIGLKFEEQKLVREFGDSYLSYRKTVPMILPRLHRIFKSLRIQSPEK